MHSPLLMQTGAGLLAYLAKGSDSHTLNLTAIGCEIQSADAQQMHAHAHTHDPKNCEIIVLMGK